MLSMKANSICKWEPYWVLRETSHPSSPSSYLNKQSLTLLSVASEQESCPPKENPSEFALTSIWLTLACKTKTKYIEKLDRMLWIRVILPHTTKNEN